MNAIDMIEYRGYNIKIYADESAENPITEWDEIYNKELWKRIKSIETQ